MSGHHRQGQTGDIPLLEVAATVDARGHRCPIPTLRLRRALARLPDGAQVELLADDPLARIDVPHFVEAQGCTLLETREQADGVLRFVVRKASHAPA